MVYVKIVNSWLRSESDGLPRGRLDGYSTLGGFPPLHHFYVRMHALNFTRLQLGGGGEGGGREGGVGVSSANRRSKATLSLR